MNRFLVTCSIVALSACYPEGRTYHVPVTIEEGAPTLPALPAIVASNAPSAEPPNGDVSPSYAPQDTESVDGATCECAPLSCYGEPVLKGGPDGCQPVLGGDGIGSIQIRTPGGESLSVWQGGDVTLSMEHQVGWSLATFDGIVQAKRFIQAQPVISVGAVAFDDEHDVYFVDPDSDTVAAHLPVAMYHAGRSITIKVIGPGGVDVLGSVNAWTNITDPVEGSTAWIEGTQGGPARALTLMAYYDGPFTDLAIPRPTGWRIVSSYP